MTTRTTSRNKTRPSAITITSTISPNNLHRLSKTVLLLLLLLSINTTTLISIQPSDALATTTNNNSKQPRRPSNNNNKPTTTGDSNTPPSSRAGSKKAADRNKRWYNNRSAGIKTKHNRKRPPRWEVEGDALFLLVEDAIVSEGLNSVEGAGDGEDGGFSETEEEVVMDGFRKKKKKKKKGKKRTGLKTPTVALSTKEEYESAVQILKSAFSKPELRNPLPKPDQATSTTTTTTTTTKGETSPSSSSSTNNSNNEQSHIVMGKTKEELQKSTIKQLKEMITHMNLPPDVHKKPSHLRLKADIINFIVEHRPQPKQPLVLEVDTIASSFSKIQDTKLLPPFTLPVPPLTQPPPSKPWMWGKCSTGPVLKSQLLSSRMYTPTPVQEAAFTTITTRNTNSGIRPNVVIASPTGTGKTLAYLLPILSVTERRGGSKTSSGRGGGSSVLIVTPTVELAVQIQAVVDKLWLPSSPTSSSALYVIGANDDPATTLQSIEDQKPPLLAGTPKSLNGLLSYCRKDPGTWAGGDGLFSNLKIVVLDEADRLLQTERSARLIQQQQIRASSGTINNNNSIINNKPSPTHELLTTLTRNHNLSLSNSSPSHVTTLQLICASATVGRTLRRQIMDLTNAASMDKAATLVCGEGDGRVGKMEDVRRRSVGPSCLKHCYRVWDGGSGNGGGKKGDGKDDRMHALWDTLRGLPPAPCLIFPGKFGVSNVCEFLSSSEGSGERGLRNVRTLRGKYTPSNGDKGDDDDGIATTMAEEFTSSSSLPLSWSTTPIYIVEERFARGLDIPNLHYVLLSTPPTSGALYTHLAGRTGRARQEGVAITLVGPSVGEAKRLVGLGQTLGIDFSSLVDLGSDG